MTSLAGKTIRWSFVDDPMPASAHLSPSASESGSWNGIGVSSGLATGTVRIIRTRAEATRLQRGEVLVAPSTDPSWTPLFLCASAIVMETGGFLSHGAIVAREYGISAVANIPGILNALRDGQPVTIDGSAGCISVARESLQRQEGNPPNAKGASI